MTEREIELKSFSSREYNNKVFRLEPFKKPLKREVQDFKSSTDVKP